MAMCLSLAAFNPLAGAPPLPVRILDPHCVAKTFPDYFETLFGVVSAEPADIPVITIDGPTASGKGTLAAPWPSAWATTCSTPARCTAPPPWRPCAPASQPDDEAGPGRLAGALDLRFDGDRVCWTAATSPTHCARGRRRLASRGVGLPGGARGAARPATGVPPRCRAWWPTAATWAP